MELANDYELELYYHLGKVNVVTDALSRKAHCNYLPVVHLTREESSTQVLPDLSLYNITLTLILRDEIIAAQKKDEGMTHIKRKMEEGDPKVACFYEDAEGTLRFKYGLVVLKREALKNKILDQKSCVMSHKTIKFLKVQWSNHMEEEATWEREDFLRSNHSDFELP
jgi:hypothetical protein